MTQTQTTTTVVEYLIPDGLDDPWYFTPELWATKGIDQLRHIVKDHLWTEGFAYEGTVERGSCSLRHDADHVSIWSWRTVKLDADEVAQVKIHG